MAVIKIRCPECSQITDVDHDADDLFWVTSCDHCDADFDYDFHEAIEAGDGDKAEEGDSAPASI